MGSLPYFTSTQRDELFAIRYGQIVARRKGAYSGETRLFATSTLCGVGAEELSQFPGDPEMVRTAIKAQYDIVGIACTEYNPEHDAPDQGFVTAVAGLHTVPIMTSQKFEPGQIVRADLPDDDPSFALSAKLSPSGQSLASYPWRVVPEDYETPGNLLLRNIGAVLEDQDRWKAVMSSVGGIHVDKWLYNAKVEGDSAIMTGLLFTYVLMKMGYLASTVPVGADPYSNSHEVARAGGITAGMSAHEFAVTAAEHLGVQSPSVATMLGAQDQIYFESLRRRLLMTIFYTGTHLPIEFGQKEIGGHMVPARDPKSGAVQMGTREGLFLYNQLNHVRRRIGGDLQALDEHCSKRIGRSMSGPNRRKRLNLNIERTFM